VYGCLYTSLTKKGAVKEFQKALQVTSMGKYPRTERELVSILAELEPVADLTDPKTSPVPVDAPYLTGDGPADYEACRALADLLRAQGYVAILLPSAANPGGKNLNIYIDGVAGNIKLREGGDRIPIDVETL
jgi:RES domain-containing protein